VLATIAYPVVGVMLLITRSQPPDRPIELNRQRLSRDQGWFLLIFAFKIALGFVVFAIKPWLGWLFLAAYTLTPTPKSVTRVMSRRRVGAADVSTQGSGSHVVMTAVQTILR